MSGTVESAGQGRAYLDWASTAPLRPAARAAMIEYLESGGADPARIHQEGMAARAALESARDEIAAAFGARPREVVLTSGATESIAVAAFGATRRDPSRAHTALSAVEHSAVREWADRGPSTVVGVDRLGRVDPSELAGAVRDDTALVQVQWGNHEVATLQPVAEVIEAVQGSGALVHVDAAQAGAVAPIEFIGSGIDLMSLSGHKLGGPTGTGILLIRRGLRIPPLLVGGDQERARRAGMENVAAAIGLAAAVTEVAQIRAADNERFHRLTDRVIGWAEGRDDVTVLGDPVGRLPHLVCLGLVGVEPQPVLLGLDQRGISVHSGSSCSSEAFEPSPVLASMGVDAERSLRVSVGWGTTDADIDRLLGELPLVLDGLHALRT